jgi:hypothetical protein
MQKIDIIPAILKVNIEELYYPLSLMLRGEKSNSSALNVGSVPPSPYRSFQSLQGALYPDYASETFLSSTTQYPSRVNNSSKKMFNCRCNSLGRRTLEEKKELIENNE